MNPTDHSIMSYCNDR